MKILGILVAICLTIYTLNKVHGDFNKAMETCQKNHNYNTCAYILLR